MPGTTPYLKLGDKTVGNDYAGHNSHVSTDITANPEPIEASPEDATEYPKYRYPKDGSAAKLVNSREEEDALQGEHSSFPVAEVSYVPFEDKDLEDMSRSDLAAYGNQNYGLSLKGTQSRDDLSAAIKQAAEAKAQQAKDAAEAQKQADVPQDEAKAE